MLLRSVVALLCCGAVLVGRAWAEPLLTRVLDDAQVAQLYQAACSDSPHPSESFGKRNFVCLVRNYPGTNPIDPNSCDITFRADDERRFDIFYGQFTAPRPQALAMYYGWCEPHANYYGGMALFDVIDGKFRLVRFIPAHVYKECVVLPPDRNGLQTPYCRDWFQQHGEEAETFGPVTFLADGTVRFDRWYDAGNVDGHAGPAVPCTGKVVAHHMLGLRVDIARAEVILDVAMRPAEIVAEVCRRYRRRDFSAEEKIRRENFRSLEAYGLVREDEDQIFVTKEVRFRPPNKTPRISP